MEQHYKAFMDKQHPSEDLVVETISKAKKLSENQEKSMPVEDLDNRVPVTRVKGTHRRLWGKYKWGMIALAVICLISGLTWQWNTRIVYPDLITEFSPDENSDYMEKRSEEFGEERNSYKSFNSSYFYVFDKDAQKTEIEIGKGTIMVQTGTVKIAGNQLLYQIKPQNIKGIEVFLGKTGTGEEETLYAAFDLGDIHYYMVSECVTEKEMTAYIKELIKRQEKKEKIS